MSDKEEKNKSSIIGVEWIEGRGVKFQERAGCWKGTTIHVL
jgi:hypothetical protein